MFIRTIKMINERRDETIRQLFNMSSARANDHNSQKPRTNNHQDSAKGFTQHELSQRSATDDVQSLGGFRERSARQAEAPNVVVKLEPMIEFLNDRQSSLEADLKVCQLIESGVHSLIGPTEGASIQHVQSICDNMELPYFELRPFLGSSSSAQVSSSGGTGVPAPSLLAANQDRGLQHTFPAQSKHHVSQRDLLRRSQVTDSTNNLHNEADESSAEPKLAFKPERTLSLVKGTDDGVDKGKSNGKHARLKVKDSLNVSQKNQMHTLSRNERATITSVSINLPLDRVLPLEFEAMSQDDHDNLKADNGGGEEENDNNNNNTRFNMEVKQPLGAREALTMPATINTASSSSHQFKVIATAEEERPQEARTQTGGQQPLQLPFLPTIYNKLEDLTLNLYPPAYLLTSAYIDLIYAWNWTSFAIVYEDENSMIKLQDLFKESSGTWTSKWQIKLFQFRPQRKQDNSPSTITTLFAQESFGENHADESDAAHATPSSGIDFSESLTTSASYTGNYFNLGSNKSETKASLQPDQATNHNLNVHKTSSTFNARKNILRQPFKRKKSTFRDIFWQIKLIGETNIILDVNTENLYEALKQAQQVGCMTERYSYLITSLDLHTVDLEDFKYSRTRMTALNMLKVSKYQAPIVSESISSNVRLQNATIDTITHQPYPEKLLLREAGTTEEFNHVENERRFFDEKYLEKLGIHVIPQNGEQSSFSDLRFNHARTSQSSNQQSAQHYDSVMYHQSSGRSNHIGYKLSPPVVLERSGAFLDPPSDVYKDWSRREMLLSSPASMSLLPQLDRDNEQRLFEFFIDQQERNFTRVRLSTSSAVLHDSLLLFTLGLQQLDPDGEFVDSISSQQQQKLACSLGSSPWLHGSSLVNYMRQTSFTGLTGQISFDQRGFRSDFTLDVMGMAPDIGLIKVGEWHSANAVVSSPSMKFSTTPASNQEGVSGSNKIGSEVVKNSKSYDELSKFYEAELLRYKAMLRKGNRVHVPYSKTVPQRSNGALLVNDIIFERLYREQADQVDTLIVTTKLSQPYFMLKETPNKLEGNDQYEGFAVDLIHELSKLVNFKYRWREVADKKYGSKETLANGTTVWNGMIGEIVRGQADLAIVDLTITAQREEAVDFTLPFMNTGISILFKKPTTKVTTLFSFLSPFSSDVWAYVLAAYCGISANLFFVGHLSPYEWADPHPCRHSNDDDNETVLKNQFSLLNSFWFTIGSLMQQGSDLTPRSMSTRTIAGIWYFFTLIMISSYTANLAAFLTVEKVVYPIENVRDLSNQEEIKYGCVESGSTCTFFHDSQIETYKKINETMRKFRTYVRSNDEGQKRVEEGKFAFFMESASIEYIIERNCNLTQIGGLLDSKGYGLATSKRSRLKRPYRTLLSEGILHLQETGMLHILKNRWWKERRGGGTCTDDGKGSGVTELSLANVGGVFVVLLGGLGISFLVAIAEFMWRSRRSGSTRDRMCEEMMSDLKFALACKSSTKPINQHKSASIQQKHRTQSARNHLTKQQSSLVSLSSDLILDPNNLEQLMSLNPDLLEQFTKSDKDCDPVLLHAMLTMLMQQQQQQQQRQQEMVDFFASQRQKEQNRQQQLDKRGNRLPINSQRDNFSRPMSGLSSDYQQNNRFVHSNQYWPGSSQSEQQQDRYASTTDRACKRRLLFAAQQTIDDSLLGQDTLFSRHDSEYTKDR